MALIIFDIDGTLLQTELVTVAAVRETFAEFGLPLPDEATVRATFGQPVEDYEAWLAAQCPARGTELVEATNERELELIGEAGRLYPGARDALTELKDEGHRLAICSNGHDRYVAEFVRAHDLRPLFDLVCARGTAYSGKADMIADILCQIPERPVIVIGDRRDDIDSAHEHGALAIGAAYGFGSPEERAAADALIDAAKEIPETARRLLEKRQRP